MISLLLSLTLAGAFERPPPPFALPDRSFVCIGWVHDRSGKPWRAEYLDDAGRVRWTGTYTNGEWTVVETRSFMAEQVGERTILTWTLDRGGDGIRDETFFEERVNGRVVRSSRGNGPVGTLGAESWLYTERNGRVVELRRGENDPHPDTFRWLEDGSMERRFYIAGASTPGMWQTIAYVQEKGRITQIGKQEFIWSEDGQILERKRPHDEAYRTVYEPVGKKGRCTLHEARYPWQ